MGVYLSDLWWPSKSKKQNKTKQYKKKKKKNFVSAQIGNCWQKRRGVSRLLSEQYVTEISGNYNTLYD